MNAKRLTKIVLVILLVSIGVSLLFACNEPIDKTTTRKNTDEDINKDFDSSDLDSTYDEGVATVISFSDGSASVSGIGASAIGTDVVINSKGVYLIKGSTSDGSISVDVGKKNEVQLVLDGVELTNSDGPAILIKSGSKITITLAKNKINKISDGESYNLLENGSAVDGAIFSKSNLIINGEGALVLNGRNAHGIVSKDELSITGGTLDVTAAGSGICGKDALKITNAQITVNAGTDALKSDNDIDEGCGYIYIKDGSFDLTSVNDGIQAFGVVSIEGGNFKIKTISTLSTASAKAIKGGSSVTIKGGSFDIDTEDDALHSNGDIYISGGEFSIISGDDGIHADNTLEISSGRLIIENSYEGVEATDIIVSGGYIDITSSDDGMNASGGNDSNASIIGGRPGGDMFGSTTGSITVSGGYIIIHNEGDGVDANGTLEVSGGVILVDGPQSGGNGSFDYGSSAKITGGVVITLGTSDMAQNFTEATQGSVLVSSGGYFPAGTVLSICDDAGNVILAFTSTKAFRGALFSAPELEKGKTYTFYANATVEGLDENGYAHNTKQTGGESCGSVTLDDYICGQGSSMPGGGPGGPGGRPR